MKITIELDGLNRAELIALRGALKEFHGTGMTCDESACGDCHKCSRMGCCDSMVDAFWDIANRIKAVDA